MGEIGHDELNKCETPALLFLGRDALAEFVLLLPFEGRRVEVLIVLSSLAALTLDAVEQDPPSARAVKVPPYDANMRQCTRFEEVLREERRLFLAATSQGLEQRRPLSQRDS